MDSKGKGAFHAALAGVFLPGVGQLLSVVLAASYAFRGGAWGRRLAALAGVDLLVFAAVLVLTFQKAPAPAPPAGPRIGVQFDEEGTRVRSVLKDWPAERAGVRAGDVLRAVDGVPLRAREEFIAAIHESVGERVLTIEREGTSLEIRVTPRHPEPGTRGLFEVDAHPRSTSLGREAAAGYGVALATIVAAWLAGRRHPGPRVWRGFLLAMLAFVAAAAGADAAARALQGGSSTGGTTLVLIAGHMGLGLGGLLAARWLRSDRPPEPPPALGRLRALGLAAYYTLTAYPRAGLILVAADALFMNGRGKPPDALEELASTLYGPLGVALFALAVAVVGPIAEEIVFRGYLLPRLAARLGRSWALAVTSLVFGGLHANYGVYALLTVVLGWTLGWARLSSGGLAAPIALHMLLNGIVSVVFFLGRG